MTKNSKSTASSIEDATMSVNERILRDCNNLYTDPKDGLVFIARDIDLNLLVPRKKINILLIGNHSAGKSSFINWYVEETVQRTGVAIETQGFTLVTSGKKRESLTVCE
jgi:predicted GTPase